MRKRGFTLIELLITIAIIGILAAAATTAYIGTTKKAARSEAYSNLESLRLLEEQFFADSGRYTVSLGAAGSTVAVRDANLVAIQTTAGEALPGFRPGNAANFSYRIIQDIALDTAAITVPYDGANVGQTPCFIAIAEGLDATRVEDDIFAIDCNNDRTF